MPSILGQFDWLLPLLPPSNGFNPENPPPHTPTLLHSNPLALCDIQQSPWVTPNYTASFSRLSESPYDQSAV